MRQITKILSIFLIVCCLILSSCATSKNTMRYQTISQRAQIELGIDEHQYTMNSTIKMWKNELIVVSIQPMLGIEMVRAEITPDSVWVFDKMNRCYVTMDYKGIREVINHKITFNNIQRLLAHHAPKKENKRLEFKTNNHRLRLFYRISLREKDTLQEPQRLNTNRYRQVTLREILPL